MFLPERAGKCIHEPRDLPAQLAPGMNGRFGDPTTMDEGPPRLLVVRRDGTAAPAVRQTHQVRGAFAEVGRERGRIGLPEIADRGHAEIAERADGARSQPPERFHWARPERFPEPRDVEEGGGAPLLQAGAHPRDQLVVADSDRRLRSVRSMERAPERV